MEVLRNLCIIWGRPVHLQARINEEMSLLTMDSPDDDKPRRQKISDELPKPAHIVV